MTKKEREEYREEAIRALREILKPGSKVYTVQRSVSSSGMLRHISLFTVVDGDIMPITYYAAHAMEDKLSEKDGCRTIKVTGCGMDMGWHLVYYLSRTLFPSGYVPAEAGKSTGRNGSDAKTLDTDGGYALKQVWL